MRQNPEIEGITNLEITKCGDLALFKKKRRNINNLIQFNFQAGHHDGYVDEVSRRPKII